MRIGIDASRAFVGQRTGIEEYAYQVIRHLRDKLEGHQVVLYIRKIRNSKFEVVNSKEHYSIGSFKLPANWELRELPFEYFWTQIGLSWEMLVDPVDVLFVPAHTIPWIHPVHTVVTIHGLEYEHCPESYSPYSRWFHRFFVRKSCTWASKIIAVSKNTQQDLVQMYQVPEQKIEVIYNGYDNQFPISNPPAGRAGFQFPSAEENSKFILYVGRLEKRKNIEGIVGAFEVLKTKYGYEGQLYLVGRPGFGYEDIKQCIAQQSSRHDIVEKGFISEKKKWELLSGADVFLFPSLCEGFGIPILEAQSLGIPVVTSNLGPMDEVAGDSNVLVDPHDPTAIAGIVHRFLSNNDFRKGTIANGLENVKRFSWDKSARQVAQVFEKMIKSKNIIK